MPTDILADLHAYHAFIKATLSQGGSVDEDATPEAFLDTQASVRALEQAIHDMQSGDEGRPARELIDEARRNLKVRK